MGDEIDRRRVRRHATHIEVDCASEGIFLFAYITDISSMGIFIQTSDPLAVGTRLSLRFSPPSNLVELLESRAPEPLELEGEVVWNTPEGVAHGGAGMGVKFTAIEPIQRQRLLELVRAIAYLDDRDGN